MENSLRILIADDEKSNLRLLEIVLEREGHHVALASNGEEALQKARDEKPDLVISDILMPVMDGYALCREWHRDPVLSLIPFVFYTATYQDKEDEDLALALGAARFLRKPIEPISFLSQIDQVIQDAKAGRVRPVASTLADETEYLKLYNERLVQKLEMRNVDLAGSEERYRSLVSQSIDGIFLVDLQGNFLSVNKRMCETLGFSEAELLGKTIWDIVPEKYQEIHKTRLARVLRGERVGDVAEYEIKTKGGDTRSIEVSSAPYRKGGEVVGFHGIARDITQRRRGEEALRESEARFALFMQNLPGVAVIRDLEGHYVYMNEAWERVMGLRRVDFLGKSPLDSFPQEDALRLLEDDRHLPESREAEIKEVELHHASGPRWWLVTRFLLEGEHGHPPYVAALYMDITERKRAEEALALTHRTQNILNDLLRLSLEKLDLTAMLQRALGHVLAIPWLELTPKGAIFLVEGGALALKAHMGMAEALLKSCATVQYNHCLCGRAMATGEFIFTGHLDNRHETTYEGIMPHGHYCVPISAGGEVKGVMCLYLKEGHEVRPGERELLEGVASMLAGIIQRKRAEDALRESEKRFHDLVASLGEGIGIVDTSENFLFGNPAQERIFGVEPGELVGRNLAEFAMAEDFAHFRQETGLREKGFRSTYETTIRRADGEIRNLHVTSTPHLDETGVFEGTFSICMDITERKRLEEDLDKAKKLETIGMITGGVAHEIRNPLNAIQIMAAVLDKKQGNDPDIRQCVAHIKDHVHRLSTLMNDLLVLGRPSSATKFAPCDLRKLVISAAQISESGTAGSAPRILVQSESSLPKVSGDAGKITQVLVNLFQNALSLSPESTPVKVSLLQAGATVQVEVRDQGPGIAKELVPQLFQPFQSMRKGGTGLGLAIVQKIVADHGGTVEAANNDPPPGAAFTVRLPILEEKEA